VLFSEKINKIADGKAFQSKMVQKEKSGHCGLGGWMKNTIIGWSPIFWTSIRTKEWI
jgi:hypothetical protein